MCVCIRILSAACVSRRHTPRSLGTRQFPDRSPKFGIVDHRSSTDLKVPMWNRQNHIFLLRHQPCHSSNIFPNWKFSRHERVQLFSVFQSLFPSRSFQSQPSTSTNQRTLLVRRSLPAGLSKLESRSFLLLLFVSWSWTSHALRFHTILLFFFLEPPHLSHQLLTRAEKEA